jgi:uncharacterized protein DUF262/uncharacterized protein DUF1524
MASSNLLNTRTANFLDLLGNGKSYRVPPYQRDYSWEEEQWEDLWNDIIALRDKSEERHYLGALVVEDKDDRNFRIIDGQQRLATLSIFALAIIKTLKGLADSGVDPEANNQRQSSLRGRFIGEKDPASLIETSKLRLNEADDDFYQDYLVQLRRPANPKGLPKSNKLMWQCFEYYTERLSNLPRPEQNGETIARLLSETVARQLIFILITVADELDAFTVFETLNARGLELSSTDLLKNFLFSKIKVASDLERLQRRWRKLMATVGQEHFPDLLRYHLLCEERDVRTERLFKVVRGRISSPIDVFNLMDALERRAELYAALADPQHPYWLEQPASQPYIKELKLFRVRQMTPMLFAAWEQLPRQFDRVLRLASVISFRYSKVGRLNPSALEPAYHSAAQAILRGTATSVGDVFERLREIYVDDAKFRQDFSGLVVDTNQHKKLAKYILARLESDVSGRSCDSETDPGTVEHILPENPADMWAETFPRERWDISTYRLGNLTLLESAANREIGNADYSAKKQRYASSKYEITRAVAEQAPQEWTPALLESRQRAMAERAAHVWRADF